MQSKEYRKAYNLANREKVRAKQREYYRTHKKQHNAYTKAYYEIHKKQILAKQKEQYRNYTSEQKEKRKTINKLWRRKNRLKVLYGLTSKQFADMVIYQQGRCAICNKQMIGYRNCCVDHDHKTFRVRGLLCNNCNRLLGCVADNTNILQNAIDYLINGV